ncbi:hypothetical protein VOLCADRAFT_87579 [Volvox carteri f. nagariensis]|uniref:Uncharacterized protein n=1 Tax=Volvox carteri f. nagariensis TaxID=3068 RepID=D8TLP2_VOLCA|nr:uncharacterized protein VOLCADRAFT_87579 [Volvox carteri f. nagariensis]EFJ51501.1 hypothetical protein VOLCADRAFT_87579 [Volvox carteri f. nagariensis]|eukprot:XP_002947453.1 hypothetical protein VOLCADRAFT_87579 [Volvox carteri f. nagariensis]
MLHRIRVVQPSEAADTGTTNVVRSSVTAHSPYLGASRVHAIHPIPYHGKTIAAPTLLHLPGGCPPIGFCSPPNSARGAIAATSSVSHIVRVYDCPFCTPPSLGPLLLLLLATAALLGTPGASASQVALRGGSLVVQNATCQPGAAELAARDAVLLAIAANASGKAARAEFAQAYLCPDGLDLCNGLSVLESRATIEANNSYILGEPNSVYESLELVLRQNNTLALLSGGNTTFYRSTATLGANNWWYVGNGSTLGFKNSRMIFSNYMTMSVEDGGTVTSDYSVLEFNDVVLYGNNSRWNFVDSTWCVCVYGRVRVCAPFVKPRAKTKKCGLQGGTLAKWSNYSALLANTSLLLVNATLELHNTTLELWGSPLGLVNSRIVLYNGSEIDVSDGRIPRDRGYRLFLVAVAKFLCDSTAVYENIVASSSFSTTSNARGAPALGLPLGTSDALVVGEPYGTVELAAPSAPTFAQAIPQAFGRPRGLPSCLGTAKHERYYGQAILLLATGAMRVTR